MSHIEINEAETEPATPAARADELGETYGTGDVAVRALDDVTVQFDRGRFTAVMGPSGSGKSTLMHCMAGLDTPTSGRTFVADEELGLVYVLLALAILVALIGIVNTLMLSVFERTREIGLLRAVGMRRRQVRAMIRSESVIIALFGAVIGVVIGTGLGVALASSLGTAASPTSRSRVQPDRFPGPRRPARAGGR